MPDAIVGRRMEMGAREAIAGSETASDVLHVGLEARSKKLEVRRKKLEERILPASGFFASFSSFVLFREK